MVKDKSRALITSKKLDKAVTDKGSELCIVKVPKGVDINKLYNCDLNDVFQIEGVNYQASSHKDENSLLAVFPSNNEKFTAVKLKAKKTYTVSECFTTPVIPKIEVPARYIVPQITDLKQRHPIYGAEFVTELKRKNPEFYQLEDAKEDAKKEYIKFWKENFEI